MNIKPKVIKNKRFLTKINLSSLTLGEIEIYASITPASAAELQKLPEGERFLPTYNIFSETELSVNDTLYINNDRYRITHAESWEKNGYYYAQATRLTTTDKQYSDGFRIT